MLNLARAQCTDERHRAFLDEVIRTSTPRVFIARGAHICIARRFVASTDAKRLLEQFSWSTSHLPIACIPAPTALKTGQSVG